MIPEYRRGVLRLPQSDDEYATRERVAAIRTVCSLADAAEDAAHVLEVLALDPREARPDLATSPGSTAP